jgi:predicted DNA-binding protein with PD1-like motif
MAEEHPRIAAARAHDDKDLIENIEPTPSHSGVYGAGPAEAVGSLDELKTATGEDPSNTRVKKSMKADTFVASRGDMDG